MRLFSGLWAVASVAGFCTLGLVACGRTTLFDGAETLSGGGAGGRGGAVGGFGGQGGAGGAVTTCAIDQECDDLDPCTSNRCDDGLCVYPERDDDRDGFVAERCGGRDCNDLNQNVFPGHPEICTDAADNDCNGVADCLDQACALAAEECGCVPEPGGERCEGGLDEDCDTTVDCLDTDCIGTPTCGCLPSESGRCEDGVDNDCDGLIDCADSDCSVNQACRCQAASEVCSGGQDEDCDLLIDCADPDCNGLGPCSCVLPGVPEQCTDDGDNDCDGLIDCADPDCVSSPACSACVQEICDDGRDNDCDGVVDCADAACAFSPACPASPEVCNNGLDDDRDNLTDCRDPDCANNPLCAEEQSNCLTARLISASGSYRGDTTGHVGEQVGTCGGGAGEAVFYFTLSEPSFVRFDTIGTSFDSVIHMRFGSCQSGAEIACDDDSADSAWAALIEVPILYPGTYFVFVDGFTIDPDQGPNEGAFVLNAEIVANPQERCDDGLDNDGDIYVDCADPDCAAAPACVGCNDGNAPGPELGSAACTDGLDNDCDGLRDCADPDCHASPYAVTECCNGNDDNDNGVADDFSCRCVSDADCDGGQICYTHTTLSCGFPCAGFFGEICPAVALGSHCSEATDQCEF